MAASNNVSLKLLIDSKTNTVLFAEAGKDFVDFLFNLLTLPVGTVIRLLSKDNMVGCLGNLYQSVENLGDDYLQPNQSKDNLLKPTAQTSASHVPLLKFEGASASATTTKMYSCGCSYRRYLVSDRKDDFCSSCDSYMNQEVKFVTTTPTATHNPGDQGSGGGYVKGVITYMVMDDLEVKPMSTISSITLLNKFNVKEVNALEERMVDVTMAEGLKLLQVSLESKRALTTVFLGKKDT